MVLSLMRINLSSMKGHIPDKVIAQIPGIAELNTPLRLCHFFAQCSHESAGFQVAFENLNYSAEALRRIFKRHFTYDESIQYARKPIDIANRVYANRLGNRDEASGDGHKFRGRGYIQLTGFDNYAEFSLFIGEDCVKSPDLVAIKYPLASSAWFFNKRHIWDVADRGADDVDVTAVTQLINGGTNGLADRLKRFRELQVCLLD